MFLFADEFLFVTKGDAVDFSRDPENKPGKVKCQRLSSNLIDCLNFSTDHWVNFSVPGKQNRIRKERGKIESEKNEYES